MSFLNWDSGRGIVKAFTKKRKIFIASVVFVLVGKTSIWIGSLGKLGLEEMKIHSKKKKKKLTLFFFGVSSFVVRTWTEAHFVPARRKSL